MKWISRYSPQRTRAENAEFVVNEIRNLGFSVDAGSRIARMHRVLTEGPEIVKPDESDFETALEAERDLQMLGFIFDVLGDQFRNEEFRQRFRTVLRDSVLPQDDLQASFGRDAQFEFYIAAVCAKAGLEPIQIEEPDVTCHLGSKKVGIAAKRIKNHTNLKDRVRKAAEQIHESGLPGFVAVDTCVALNRENERIKITMTDEVFMRIHKKAVREFIKYYHDKMQEWVRATGVRGIIIHDQQVRYLRENSWVLSGMTMWVDTTRHNAGRKKEFLSFIEKYRRGIPNAEDV